MYQSIDIGAAEEEHGKPRVDLSIIVKAMALTSTALTVLFCSWWICSDNTSSGFLGGLPLSASFNWHVCFMMAAFVLFSAIKILSPNAMLKSRLNFRFILKIFIILFLFGGIYAVYLSKDEHLRKSNTPKRHFVSLHSWIGLTIATLAVLNSLMKQNSVYDVFMEDMLYVFMAVAVESGIAEKEIHLSCLGIGASEKHVLSGLTESLSLGCKTANFVGLLVVITLVLVMSLSPGLINEKNEIGEDVCLANEEKKRLIHH